MKSAEEANILTDIVKTKLEEREAKRKRIALECAVDETIDFCEKYLDSKIEAAIQRGKNSISIEFLKMRDNLYHILEDYQINKAGLPYKIKTSGYGIDLETLQIYLVYKYGYSVTYQKYKENYFVSSTPTGKVYGVTYEKNTIKISW